MTTSAWDPLRLSVIAGTEYDGRDIPLAWQVEFEPADPKLAAANERLRAIGIDPDGYGWSEAIDRAVEDADRALRKELHFGDTETSTCVVWVESEDACRRLVEVIWHLVSAGWAGEIRDSLTEQPHASANLRRHGDARAGKWLAEAKATSSWSATGYRRSTLGREPSVRRCSAES